MDEIYLFILKMGRQMLTMVFEMMVKKRMIVQYLQRKLSSIFVNHSVFAKEVVLLQWCVTQFSQRKPSC